MFKKLFKVYSMKQGEALPLQPITFFRRPIPGDKHVGFGVSFFSPLAYHDDYIDRDTFEVEKNIKLRNRHVWWVRFSSESFTISFMVVASKEPHRD